MIERRLRHGWVLLPAAFHPFQDPFSDISLKSAATTAGTTLHYSNFFYDSNLFRLIHLNLMRAWKIKTFLLILVITTYKVAGVFVAAAASLHNSTRRCGPQQQNY